ncbi:MAG: hypothetical protein AAF485_17285 [Chloroflexota bacterium]
MKNWIVGSIFILSLLVLTGCGGDEAEAAANQTESNQASQNGGRGGGGFESAYLNRDFDGALSPTMQLTLGTLKLEESGQAITIEQASKLLPLWQGLQSGDIQNGAERNAILKQIESTMTADQMNEIASMQLTFETMAQWAESNGLEVPQGRFGRGGENGPFANLSEEERTKLREELQNMTQEERQARLQELGIEVGNRQGGQGGGGQGRQGGGQGRRGGAQGVIMAPLVELLTARASE